MRFYSHGRDSFTPLRWFVEGQHVGVNKAFNRVSSCIEGRIEFLCALLTTVAGLRYSSIQTNFIS